jgi:hypothetical protein
VFEQCLDLGTIVARELPLPNCNLYKNPLFFDLVSARPVGKAVVRLNLTLTTVIK